MSEARNAVGAGTLPTRARGIVPDNATGEHRPRFGGAALFALLVVAIAAAALWISRNYDSKTGMFPWVVGVAVLVLAVAQFIRECTGRTGAATSAFPGAEETADAEVPPEVAARRTASVFAWIVASFASIWLLGFAIGCSLCTLLQLRFDGRERWSVAIFVAAFVWALIHFFFDRLLNTPFPPGALFVWLELPGATP